MAGKPYGFTPDKQALCKELGIELLVSKRIPRHGLRIRSTSIIADQVICLPISPDLQFSSIAHICSLLSNT